MEWLTELLDKLEIAVQGSPILTLFFVFIAPFLEAFIPLVPLTAIALVSVGLFEYILPTIFLAKIFALAICFGGSYLGSISVYLIVRNFFKERVDKKFAGKKIYETASHKIANSNTFVLSIILSLPIMPISIFNIAFALSDVKKRKYFIVTGASRALMLFYIIFLGGNIFNLQEEPVKAFLSIGALVLIMIIGYFVSKGIHIHNEHELEKNRKLKLYDEGVEFNEEDDNYKQSKKFHSMQQKYQIEVGKEHHFKQEKKENDKDIMPT